MIIDSSAIIAIALQEPGWEAIFDKLAGGSTKGVGTPTLVETGIVLTARIGVDARPLLSRMVQEFGISVVPFGEMHWHEAVEAFRRFGKGRHAASLNFGDCMAYATAKLAARPLLCTGGDFAQTDLPLA